jgi:hypothetical protein
MALKPLTFGVRLKEGNRTVKVRAQGRGKGYVLEDRRGADSTRHRDHTSLQGALRDLASTWRSRLH